MSLTVAASGTQTVATGTNTYTLATLTTGKTLVVKVDTTWQNDFINGSTQVQIYDKVLSGSSHQLVYDRVLSSYSEVGTANGGENNARVAIVGPFPSNNSLKVDVVTVNSSGSSQSMEWSILALD